jgi:hypothetical protein
MDCYLCNLLILVNGGDPFIGEFDVGPSGEANFDISGPSGPSPGGFTNTGLELTPDNFGNFPNVNQREFPNVNQREFPNVNQPRDSFPEDAPNLPLCKYAAHCFHNAITIVAIRLKCSKHV